MTTLRVLAQWRGLLYSLALLGVLGPVALDADVGLSVRARFPLVTVAHGADPVPLIPFEPVAPAWDDDGGLWWISRSGEVRLWRAYLGEIARFRLSAGLEGAGVAAAGGRRLFVDRDGVLWSVGVDAAPMAVTTGLPAAHGRACRFAERYTLWTDTAGGAVLLVDDRQVAARFDAVPTVQIRLRGGAAVACGERTALVVTAGGKVSRLDSTGRIVWADRLPVDERTVFAERILTTSHGWLVCAREGVLGCWELARSTGTRRRVLSGGSLQGPIAGTTATWLLDVDGLLHRSDDGGATWSLVGSTGLEGGWLVVGRMGVAPIGGYLWATTPTGELVALDSATARVVDRVRLATSGFSAEAVAYGTTLFALANAGQAVVAEVRSLP